MRAKAGSRSGLNLRMSLVRLVEAAASAASSYVCLGDDAAEQPVVGMVIAPDDALADYAGLLGVAGVVGAVQREVPQCRGLRLYAV